MFLFKYVLFIIMYKMSGHVKVSLKKTKKTKKIMRKVRKRKEELGVRKKQKEQGTVPLTHDEVQGET